MEKAGNCPAKGTNIPQLGKDKLGQDLSDKGPRQNWKEEVKASISRPYFSHYNQPKVWLFSVFWHHSGGNMRAEYITYFFSPHLTLQRKKIKCKSKRMKADKVYWNLFFDQTACLKTFVDDENYH